MPSWLKLNLKGCVNMATMEVFGFNEFANKLERIYTRSSELFGEHDLTEVFSTAFMRTNTNFENLDDFLAGCGVAIACAEDLDSIPKDYMRKTSSFGSWADMLAAAQEKFVADKLGL